MPQALAFVFPATFGVLGSIPLVTAAGGLTLGGSLVSLAGSLLLSAALAPSQPDAPTPENIKLNIRQSVGARVKHYGRVKAGGTVVYFRTRSGKFYRVVVHGHGEIDGIEKYFLNKGEVTINGAGEVQEDQYQSGGRSRVILKNRFGTIPETNYSEITAIWAEWDVNHRGDGLWSSLTIAEQTPPDDFRRVYPNNEPGIEILARTSKVYDPRTGLTAFSENAALVIADLIESPDGFNRPGKVNTAFLIAAANAADAVTPLAAGGAEPKWRIAGSYSLAEQPQGPLRRMLDVCGGDVRLLPDGTIGIEMGEAIAPTVTLTGADVLEYVDGNDGPDLLDRYNTLPFTYVDPALSYTQAEGDPWHDAACAAVDGEESTGPLVNFDMSPSHRQARHAAKIKMGRSNPHQRFTVRFRPRALIALYESVIRLTDDEAGIDGIYRVENYTLSLSDGSVSYALALVDQADFAQSIAEEGRPQVLPTPDVSLGIPTPTNFAAGPQGVQTSGSTFAAGIAAVWDAPPSDALSAKLEYSPTGAGTWQIIPVASGSVSAQSIGLVDGAGYDLRLSFVANDGTTSLTPATLTNIIASASTVAPDAPTLLAVLDITGGVATVSLTASASANIWKTEIYRDAALVASFYTDALENVSFDDACGAGTFDWTARSINVSSVANATDAGPVTQTIT